MIREELICAKCLDFLKVPKVLACLHSFCRDCLVSLYEVRRCESAESVNASDVDVVCPSCNKATLVSNEHGIDGLVTHVELADSIEKLSENEKEKVRSILQSRQDRLNSFLAGNEAGQTPTCSCHKKPQEFFCRDCIQLVCEACTRESHQSHCFDTAIQCLPQYLEHVRQLVQPAHHYMSKAESSLKQLSQDYEAIQANRNMCTEAINELFNRVRAMIDDREKMLLATVNKYTDAKLTHVNSYIERLTETQSHIKARVQVAEKLLDKTSDLTVLNDDGLAEELHVHQQTVQDVESDVHELMFSSTYVGFRDDNIKHVQKEISSLISLCEYFPDADSGYYLSRKIDEEGEDDACEPHLSAEQVKKENQMATKQALIRKQSLPAHHFKITPLSEEEENELDSSLHDQPEQICLVRSLSSPAMFPRRGSLGVNPPVPIRFDSLLAPTPIVQPEKVFDKLSRSKTDVVQPCGVCIGDNDCIVVSDVRHHCLRIIASTGKFIDTIGNEGKGSGEFEEPCGIAVDHKMNILVTQRENPRIQKLSSSGKYQGKFWQKTLRGNNLGEPWGIAVSPDKKVFVTDWDRHCIHVFNSSGRYDRSICDEKDSLIGESLKLPAGITFNSDGKLLVADRGNHCIWMLDLDGSILLRIGSKGQGPGELYYPYGIATAKDGSIVVTESGNNRISIFSSTGIFQKHFGRKGSEPGMFDHPRHVCVNTKCEIVVADELNQRLQLFKV